MDRSCRCDKETRLWLVDLKKSAPTVAQPISLKANSSLALETMPERLAFLHAALGYPVPATFEKAIEQGHYTSIPELTLARVRKILKPSAATIKGHLDMARKTCVRLRQKRNASHRSVSQEQQKIFRICNRQSRVWNAATQYMLNASISLAKYIRI